MTPEVIAALERDGTIDITTTGARSGLPRRNEIWFMQLAGRTFITGTSDPTELVRQCPRGTTVPLSSEGDAERGSSSPCNPGDG